MPGTSALAALCDGVRSASLCSPWRNPLRVNSLSVRCLNCHYSLLRLREHRCPECGRPFDPADQRTYELASVARRGRRLTWFMLVMIIVVILFLIAAFIPVLRMYPVF